MKVLLINPPYQTITSNFGVGHQIPLGLLMVGGPLLDAGHEVRLLDAECRRLSLEAVVRRGPAWGPDVVMTGHAGSTPAHPTCIRMLAGDQGGAAPAWSRSTGASTRPTTPGASSPRSRRSI